MQGRSRPHPTAQDRDSAHANRGRGFLTIDNSPPRETHLTAAFAAAMARLGPFEPHPRLAAAVSGGADSTALALLADAWVRQRGGSLLALIVDHGLRPESADEARLTAERLTARGIAVRELRAVGLTRGSAMAERARAARYQLLTAACAAEGILHLLLGHHAADQAETVMMRALRNSGARGLAAMPALAETASLRLLRPLLTVAPDRLRRMLTRAGMPWVEDPSNRDLRTFRARLRYLRERDGSDSGTEALSTAAAGAGRQRALGDERVASALAARVTIRPEGFAILTPGLTPGPVAAEALAALIQAIGGAAYPPGTAQLAALAADLGPATLAGVRFMPAGRLGPGLLAVREANAMAPCVPGVPGATWDGRFRIDISATLPEDAMFGPLGADAARVRRWSDLPSAVLCTLPALRVGKVLAIVPHLLYPDLTVCAQMRLISCVPRPLAGAPFGPPSQYH